MDDSDVATSIHVIREERNDSMTVPLDMTQETSNAMIVPLDMTQENNNANDTTELLNYDKSTE